MAIIGQDGFTVGSDTNLDAHTPDTVGTGWTESTAGGIVVIAATDVARCTSTSTRYGRLDDDAGDDEMTVTADCSLGGVATTMTCGVMARVSNADFQNLYEAFLVGDGTAIDVVLRKVVANVTTQIGSWDGNLVIEVFYELKLEIGNGTQKVYVDGVERISTTEADSVLAGNTRAGIRIRGSGVNFEVDNFLLETASGAASYDQVAYRFRNDDGSLIAP